MTNTWGEQTGGSGSIADTGPATTDGAPAGAGSKLVLTVPAYDGSKGTYLRLGAAPAGGEAEPGLDLAQNVGTGAPASAASLMGALRLPTSTAGTLLVKVDGGAAQTVS